MNENSLPTRAMWPLAEQGGGTTLPAHLHVQPAPAADQSELNLGTLWRIINQWRWLILSTVAAGIAGALIVTMLTTPIYRATTLIEINPPTVEVIASEKAGDADSSAHDRDYLATQYGLMRSRSLAERAAQELNLASHEAVVSQELDPGTRQRVARNVVFAGLEVEPQPGSRLVQLSFSSPEPALAARVVNGYAEVFINSGLERRYQATSYARNFLQRQINRLKGELESSERQLVAYAQQQGLINVAGAGEGAQGQGSSLASASLTALNQALAQAQSRLVTAEQRYRQSLSNATTAEVSERTSSLRMQVAGLEAEYQEKLTRFLPDYPDMVRLRTRIRELQQAIRNEATNVSGSRSNTLRAEYAAALAEERSLQARIARLRGAVLDERGRSIRYNILQRELDTNRALYDALLERYRAIGVAGGVGAAQASIVDVAQAPGSPYKPNLILNLLIGLLAGLLAGVTVALALEFISDTIKTPDDVRDKLHLTWLGGIPNKKNSRSMAEELQDPGSPVAEAYFSLRTSLQFTTETGAPKTLLVTSTRAAEGKSSTTLALVQNFARLGNRVLLIDGDLRKPVFVSTDQERGISKLLTTNESIAEHVQQTSTPNLSLIACGPVPPNPAELLASPRLLAIIEEAAAAYDMIIIDGPPVLGLADAPLLGSVCRATLMVIESGKTRTPAAREAIARLRASSSQVIGAVLTRYRHRTSEYGYGYEAYGYGGVSSRDREIRLLNSNG